MSLFHPLKKLLSTYLDRKSIARIESAYLFSEHAHKEQIRSSGEPYITHPLAVAKLLAEMHLDAETIMAALMHDVMEDTQIDKKTISEHFGERVADLVDGVSKLTKIKFETKLDAQAENFRKMILAMAKDIRVILVKLADRLHNMRTLLSLRPDKRARIAKETLEIYAPIANRLGMHTFRLELENLCFKTLYPYRHRILESAVLRLQGNQKDVTQVIKTSLEHKLKNAKLPKHEIIGREKSLYSIYQKMKHKRLSFNDITDMYAFRILVNTQDECYRVLGLVHNLYKPVPERFKDYIALPKANGYQSLHTTLFGPYGVPIEIQIRTREMDSMARQGIAAHWAYKQGDNPIRSDERRTQVWLERLLEIQRSAVNTVDFIENVKIDLFPDEIYVFTPQGKIIGLPQGATPVDFAYAVHSDIGNACVAAKINRKFMPLSALLANGQTVEIITAPNSAPQISWLDFVVTGKARSNIRHFLKHPSQGKENVYEKEKEFEASLKLRVLNRRGVLADITKIFSVEGADIQDVCVLANKGDYSDDSFSIVLKSRQQLANIMRQLRTLKAVLHIERQK